jgi:hypothetical protein
MLIRYLQPYLLTACAKFLVSRYTVLSRSLENAKSKEVNGLFQLTKSFQPLYGPGVDSSLTEMSTKNLPGCKARPARKADNLSAICEPIV